MENNNITLTGIGGLKGIRGEDLYKLVSDEELLNLGKQASNANYNALHGHIGYEALNSPALTTPLVINPDTLLGLLGSSSYDRILTNPSPEEIGDYRAASLPWLNLLGAGILKGTALAGTTFLDGTLGLLYGIGSAIDTWTDGGSFSEGAGEIFNNKLSKGLRAVNEYMEEALPVYRTLDEIENPMALRNLFSMSTIADDFIKNMGFTVGAFYSGNAYLKAIKGLNGLVKSGELSATAAKTIGSMLSGINEGRIEAGNLFDETYKNGEESLMETYRPLYELIMSEPDTLEINPETGVATSSRQRKLNELQNRLNAEKENLKLRATNAGLMDLVFNSVYLPMTDFYTYGKLYTRGFKSKKDLAGRVGKSIDNAAEQASKLEIFGNRIIKDASGKYDVNLVSRGKSALKGAKIFGVEGSEEVNQALFESLAANYYSPDSPDAYYQALTNDEYEVKTKDFMTSLNQAVSDSWGNPTTYKEFLIGGLNGIIGMPTFGKVNNSDHNTWLGRGNTIGMSGGMFGEMANDAYYNQLAQEAASSMNNFVDKVNNAKMFFTRSLSFTNAMDGYSKTDDKFEFENAKDNDLFNIIDAYSRTGRILDLLDLVNQDFEDLSEERLKEIAQDTESPTNEWRNVDGTLMSDSEEGREQMIEKLLDKREAIINGIKSYEKALQKVRSISNNSLTEDLNAELAWLAWKQDRFTDRFNSIKEEQQQFIDKLAKATDAFLRGRGIGALTLNIEDVAPEIEEYDDLGRITGSRKKTEEEKLKEVETGLNIKKSMETVSLFLNLLNEAESPLQLAYFVKNNPKIAQFIDDIGFDLLEGLVPMTYDEYTEGMAVLKDTARIAIAHKSFSDRYRKFTDDPSKVILNRLKIELEKQKVDRVKGKKNVADEIRNTSVGDLARGASEGDLNFDDILSQMEEMQQSNKDGISNEDNPYQELIDKIKEALNLNQTYTDLINSILQDGNLSELLIDDALNLVLAAYQLADSVDDLIDIDMEAYNDARNLLLNGDTDEVILERLDEANNLIHQKTQELAQRSQVSQDMPSSSDTPVLPIDRGTTNSRDPLDISETELERITREKREKEETQRKEAQRDSNLQSWNNLVTQAFGQSELPPVLSEDILKVIKPLVDDAIDNGLTDNQMMLVLNDDNTFKSLNTMTKGGLLSAVLQYKEARKNSSVLNSPEITSVLNKQNNSLDNNYPLSIIEVEDVHKVDKNNILPNQVYLQRKTDKQGYTKIQVNKTGISRRGVVFSPGKTNGATLSISAKDLIDDDFYETIYEDGKDEIFEQKGIRVAEVRISPKGDIAAAVLVPIKGGGYLYFEVGCKVNPLNYLSSNQLTDKEQNALGGSEQKTQEKEISIERGTPTPDITNYTSTSAPRIENDGLPTIMGKYQFIAPSLRKSIPNRDGIISDYEDSDRAKQRYTKPTLDRMKVIRKFLEERNAFNNVDNNAVKVGDKLSLVVYPEVIDTTGELIIFMQTSDGKIVGDLPSRLYSTTKDYAGLLDLITKIELAYAEWIKDENNKGKPFIYSEFKPTVTLNLIGQVVYTRELLPINTIFGDKLQLALCLTENGLFQMFYDGGKTRKSRTARDNQVMMPLNPTSGMPYVLVESSDPNRKYVPIPFRMVRYDGNTNTMLGKAIHGAVNDIITENVPNESLKDALLDLIALEDAWLEINGNNITFRIKRLGATQFETIINNEPRTTDLIDRIIDSLKGNPYQVSRKYINGIYDKYFENGVPVKWKYNQMIGEIATANIGATHTQGDWFITEPATGTASKIGSTRNNPNHKATVTDFIFNGIAYTITKEGLNGVESWIVRDSKGNIINDDNLRAYGYGIHRGYPMDRQYNVPWSVNVDRNGEVIPTSIYNPKSNKYILPPLTNIVDLNAAMALLRGLEGKDYRTLGNPYERKNSTGVPSKVQLEIAEANAEARRTVGERRIALENHPFRGEPLQEGDINEARLDTINATLLDFFNSIKAEKGKLLPEKSPWQLWREYYADRDSLVSEVTELDRMIMDAVLDNRRNKKERNWIATVELAGFAVTPAFAEETIEGQPQLVMQISFELASTKKPETPKVETSKYKVDDKLEGLGSVWQVTSINDDGSITVKSIITDTILKLTDYTISKFTPATDETVLKVKQEAIDEILKPITVEEVQGATNSSIANSNFLHKDEITGISYTLDGLFIRIKGDKLPKLILDKYPEAYVVIKVDNGEARVHILGTTEAYYTSKEDEKSVLNRYISKELQDYIFLSWEKGGTLEVELKFGVKFINELAGEDVKKFLKDNGLTAELLGFVTPALVQQVLDNFSGYFEGGGRVIQDDFPGFNELIASKFENYVMGDGEFTEDDAIEFLNEIQRILNAKETGTKTPNPEIDLLSPTELKEKAELLGLLGTNERNEVWNNLTPEQLNLLIASPIATSKMTMLETAYIDEDEGFDESMLGNKSINEFLNDKPKFLKSLHNEKSNWDEHKERAWLEKALPQFSTEERLLIIETLKTLDGQDAYGQFWNGVITIARNAVRGTMYHEAFHGVVNTLLTLQEYTDLFNAAIEQYGNLSIDDLEERLAEDFRRYTKLLEKPMIGMIVKIFRKLKHFILNLIGNEPYINKLFYDINDGKFVTIGIDKSNTLRYSSLASNRFLNILDNNINNIKLYPIYNDYRKKSSIVALNKAWDRWKDKMESLYNVTIKGYRDNDTNKWIIASVTPKKPKYLRALYIIEMNQIELEAIKKGDIVLKKDGSFDYAKAPNSEKSNLNELQWLQVRTKAFKDWFGDWENDPANASKVVDENGEPLVVYHSNDADKFDIGRKHNWFSSKRQTYYGNRQYPVFLNVRNLFRRDNPTMEERAMVTDYGTGNKYDKLPKEYDGGMVYHKTFGYYELLTTGNSNQIKSATDNEGSFSRSENNIYDSDNIAIEQRGRDMFNFEFLTEEDLLFIKERVGIEEYNKMSLNQKEVLLHCK